MTNSTDQDPGYRSTDARRQAREPAGDADNGKPEPNDPPETPPLNKQIVEAVKKSTDFAFGMPKATSSGGGSTEGGTGQTTAAPPTTPQYSAGNAIAYQKVAQAAAYAVQDATDYQRNMLSINGAAQGKALALMFKDVASGDAEDLAEHAVIFVLSIVGSLAAGFTAEYIGTNAGKVLSQFPES